MILAIRLGGNDWKLIPEHQITGVDIEEHIVRIYTKGENDVYTDETTTLHFTQIPATAFQRLKATLLTYAHGGDTDVFPDDRPGSKEVRKPGKAPSTGPDASGRIGSNVACS